MKQFSIRTKLFFLIFKKIIIIMYYKILSQTIIDKTNITVINKVPENLPFLPGPCKI